MDVQTVTVFVSVLVGFLVVPLINLLKNAFGWSGKKVVILALIVSMVVAGIALFAAGWFGQVDFATPSGIVSAVTMIFSVATLVYKLTAKEIPDLPPYDPGNEGEVPELPPTPKIE
jgi:hypothetical protein